MGSIFGGGGLTVKRFSGSKKPLKPLGFQGFGLVDDTGFEEGILSFVMTAYVL